MSKARREGLDHHDEIVGALRRVLPAWGLSDLTPELISVSENLVFRVADPNRQQHYVMRVHRPGYHTLDELESEHQWTQALCDHGISAPQPFLPVEPTSTGRPQGSYRTIQISGWPTPRYVGMAHWRDGQVLEQLLSERQPFASTTSYIEQLGALIAQLHTQSAAWTPPPAFTRQVLDADGFAGEAPFWGRFWEAEFLSADQRATMTRARSFIHRALSALPRTSAEFGVIHADLHAGNVLVNDRSLAIIDFDDAGFGFFVYDLAVALIQSHRHARFDELCAAMMRGYRSVRDLSTTQEQRLPLFLMVRGAAIIGWVAARPEHQGDHTPVMVQQFCELAEDVMASS